MREVVDVWVREMESMVVFGCIDQQWRQGMNDDVRIRVMDNKHSNENSDNILYIEQPDQNKRQLRQYTGW